MRALCLVAIALLAGCFKSDAPSCTVHCAVDTDCPGSQTCTTAGTCSTGAACTEHPDAEPGADADLGPTAPLTVHVFGSDHAPLPGAEVIFITPSGGQAADTLTDSTGTAVQAMPAGSAIAVVRRDGSTTRVSTFVDLSLGATIESEAAPQITYGNVTLTWAAEPQIDRYWVYTTCRMSVPSANTTTGTSIIVALDTRCRGAYDAIVIGRDTSGGIAPVGHAVGSISGSFTFTGAWEALAVITGQVAGLPANRVSATADASAQMAQDHILTEPIAVSGLDSDGSVIVPWELPATVTPVIETTVTGAGGAGTEVMLERLTAGVTTYDGALDASALPWTSGLTTALATRELTWTSTDLLGPAEVPPDAAFAEMTFHRGADVFVWDLVAPGTRVMLDGTAQTGRVAFPEIPGDRDFEPIAGDVPDTHAVSLYALTGGGDLEAFRSRLQRTWADHDFFDDVDLPRVTISSSE